MSGVVTVVLDVLEIDDTSKNTLLSLALLHLCCSFVWQCLARLMCRRMASRPSNERFRKASDFVRRS